MTVKNAFQFQPPTTSRLKVFRDGKSITGQIPKPTILVDSREQRPLSFANFQNWVAGERVVALPVADYSIEGMESLVALERKSLEDLIGTLTQNRARFFRMCEKMTAYRWRAILVEATLEDIKTPNATLFSGAHPNGIFGSLDAVETKFDIPVIYTSMYRQLAEEKAASWLSKIFTYHYLEQHGMGRFLQEGDL